MAILASPCEQVECTINVFPNFTRVQCWARRVAKRAFFSFSFVPKESQTEAKDQPEPEKKGARLAASAATEDDDDVAFLLASTLLTACMLP